MGKLIEINAFGSYVLFVPNRKSTSILSPSVGYYFGDLKDSTKEAYEKQYGISEETIKIIDHIPPYQFPPLELNVVLTKPKPIKNKLII